MLRSSILIAVVIVLITQSFAWGQKSKKPAVAGAAAAAPRLTRDSASVTAAIDREVDQRLAEHKVPASPLADDAEFLRRVTIDIIGRIPTHEEAAAFLQDTDPDKRRKWIDDLLASPVYGQHFQDIWRGLIETKTDAGIRSNSQRFGPWLTEQFNQNRGWNETVYAMLTAQGEISQTPETGFIMAQSANAQPQADRLAIAATKLFLGVGLACAECHDHPFASWKQEDFWATAAFFGRVRNSDPKGGSKTPRLLEMTVADAIARDNSVSAAIKIGPDGGIIIPASGGPGAGKTVLPRFLGSEEAATGDELAVRQSFAKWATSVENRFFAQAAVNRLWAKFFARGLFNPIDDFPVDEKEPASHPQLLELLRREFVASGFDQKHLIRAICNSQTYQRGSRPVAGNESDTKWYSHMALKTLSPEVLYDSLVGLTNVSQLKAAEPMRKGASRDPRVIFTELFRARGDGAEPTSLGYGIPQFLRRMNSEHFNHSPLLKRLGVSSMGREQAIEAIYLATLARRPTADEARLMSEYVDRRSSADEGYQGVVWILLNTGEFVLNH